MQTTHVSHHGWPKHAKSKSDTENSTIKPSVADSLTYLCKQVPLELSPDCVFRKFCYGKPIALLAKLIHSRACRWQLWWSSYSNAHCLLHISLGHNAVTPLLWFVVQLIPTVVQELTGFRLTQCVTWFICGSRASCLCWNITSNVLLLQSSWFTVALYVLCENVRAVVMAWKHVLLVIGVSVTAVAYWLYSPLPDGYSFSSAAQIQMMLATGKVVDLMVGISFLAVRFCRQKAGRKGKMSVVS